MCLLEKQRARLLYSALWKEQKIVKDIQYNVKLYDLAELYSEEEIKEAIVIISDLSRKYRHVHVELENELGVNYKEKRGDY